MGTQCKKEINDEEKGGRNGKKDDWKALIPKVEVSGHNGLT